MLKKDHLQKLILNHNLRLQALQEQKALNGLDSPPKILIEIEFIKTELESLQAELGMLDDEQEITPRPFSVESSLRSSSHKTLERANETGFEHLQLTKEQWEFLSNVLFNLNSVLNYRNILRTMVDLAFLIMDVGGGKDDSAVYLILLFEGDHAGGREKLVTAAGRNIGRSDEGRRVSSDEGLIGRTLRTVQTNISHNVQKDTLLMSFSSLFNCQSAICVPLKIGFVKYGVFLICSTKPNFYKDNHKTMLAAYCNHALIALQNAQLYEDLEKEKQKIVDGEIQARHKLALDILNVLHS